MGADVAALNPFHLRSAGVDEDEYGLDQIGGPVWAAADLAQDLPGFELGVRAFTRAALTGVGGVDRLLVARQSPPFAGLGIGRAAALRDG